MECVEENQRTKPEKEVGDGNFQLIFQLANVSSCKFTIFTCVLAVLQHNAWIILCIFLHIIEDYFTQHPELNQAANIPHRDNGLFFC